MRSLKFKNTSIEGELAFRTIKNLARLEDVEYRPTSVFDMDAGGWPGDWEGRTILAVVLLSRVTGRKTAYLDEILEALKENLNEKGYLEYILPTNVVNEQQLSGHNWLLRGLLEYYIWTGNEDIADIAKNIVENLYLPTKGRYGDYPIEPEQRDSGGGAAGHIGGKPINNWYLSTDIGCAFISLDALSQYYEIFKDDKVGALIDEMAEIFMDIDFLKANMQTHASLSACRGLMRYYQNTGKEELLDFVIKFYDFYKLHGMTENYANFNWFGRPTWTEPCAVVDSFILSTELFKETKEIYYIDMANRIYFNALGYAQRKNGGFGCDKCVEVGSSDPFINTNNDYYEAYWCCSMRGAEGLARVAINSILYENKNIYINQYFNGEYKTPGVIMKIKTQFPEEGNVTIQLSQNIGNHKFYFYIPEGTDKNEVILRFNDNEVEVFWEKGFLVADIVGCGQIELIFKIQLQVRNGINNKKDSDIHTFWHGVLLLGVKTDEIVEIDKESIQYKKDGIYKAKNLQLEPINKNIYLEYEEIVKNKIQLLF